ncbi:hypothetical protein [Lentiprolixibacter aurantiacus]|uniref:Uncharacterized protein n=1 Tax=Lentiprolixibacter aurantiacus TaxID=2993939 RepID=A0AAE3SNQ2_9FLAO|nr:hypothetical protein [Lentiprolixibacter aurantiacus]MCX2719879.1 hypothetical protein [Lentiprolixibacter aurantiacus]
MIRGLLVILLFMGLSCKSQEKGRANDPVAPGQSIELILLVSDNYGGSEHAEFRIIRDMKSLKQFFAQVNKTRKPGIPVPQVDFSKELLVLYCPGKMLNGATSSLLIRENTADQLVLSLKESKSGQKKKNGALTMPFSLYKLPLTGKEISFVRED